MTTIGTLTSMIMVLGLHATAAAIAFGGELEPIDLPVARNASKPTAGKSGDMVVVSLSSDGRVVVDPRSFYFGEKELAKRSGLAPGAQRISLAQLKSLVGLGRRVLFLKGASGHGDGSRARTLGRERARNMHVILRIDRNAPWAHVQWILSAIVPCGVVRASIATKTASNGAPKTNETTRAGSGRKDPAVAGAESSPYLMSADLPALGQPRRGPPAGAADRKRATVRIHVGSSRERVRLIWGPRRETVQAPVNAVFQLGLKEVQPDAIAKSLKRTCDEAKKAGADYPRVVVTADPEVRFRYIVAVLDQCLAAKITDIKWWDPSMVGLNAQSTKDLPWPE